MLLFTTIITAFLQAQNQTFTQMIDSTMTTNQFGVAAKPNVPYKTSIGGIVPYTSLAFGPSFKFFLTEYIAFQADIYIKGVLTAGIDANIHTIAFAPYMSIETNVNIYFQNKIKDKSSLALFWLFGGGMSFGYVFTPDNGKFGLNTIIGLEYIFKKRPLTIQLDIRPGYGLLFHPKDCYLNAIFLHIKTLGLILTIFLVLHFDINSINKKIIINN
jgi:hypothetical protein